MGILISDDGNTIISGNANKNSIKIFEWKNESWFQKGDKISGKDGGYWANYPPYDPTGCPKVSTKCFWVEIPSEFGSSTAISGDSNTIAIGAPRDWQNNINYINTSDRSGHVQIYDWVNNSWKQRGLDIIGRKSTDQLGGSISMSGDGNIIAISIRGGVQIFEWE